MGQCEVRERLKNVASGGLRRSQLYTPSGCSCTRTRPSTAEAPARIDRASVPVRLSCVNLVSLGVETGELACSGVAYSLDGSTALSQ